MSKDKKIGICQKCFKYPVALNEICLFPFVPDDEKNKEGHNPDEDNLSTHLEVCEKCAKKLCGQEKEE